MLISKKIKKLSLVLVVILLVKLVFFSSNMLSRVVYAQGVTKVEEATLPKTASSEVESMKSEGEIAEESNQQQKDIKDSETESSEKEQIAKPNNENNQPTEQESKVKEETKDTNEIKEAEKTDESEIKEETVDQNDIEKEEKELIHEIKEAEKTITALQLDAEIYSLEKDTAHEMIVTAVYSDESKEDVTKTAKYTSSDEALVEIDSTGRITAISIGNAEITVEYQGVSIQAIVKVKEPQKTVLEVPKSILTFSTQDKIYLKWDEIEGCTSYDIEINSKVHTNVTRAEYTYEKLKLNTQYSIRIRSKKQEEVSEWSSAVKVKTLKRKPISFIEYTIDLNENELVDIIVTASAIKEIKDRSFILFYDSEKLEVEDLSTATKQRDINKGEISGTDIEVKEYVPGTIKLIMNKEVDDNQVWSGVVNTIKFRSKTGGKSDIKYVVE
ncbi:Ig-like domain-containing protein [Clostridiaceae bacterium M8S5]|nr:Ig-like domain-containing protein [Clostridiaceae bacterium M8S5]